VSEQFNEDSFDTSPPLAAKVRELASPATRWRRSAHRQLRPGVRYVAINRGLRAGFGYKARKASVVFPPIWRLKDKAICSAPCCAKPASGLTWSRRSLKTPRMCTRCRRRTVQPRDCRHPVDAAVDLPGVVQAGSSGACCFSIRPTNSRLWAIAVVYPGHAGASAVQDCEGLLQVPAFAPENDSSLRARRTSPCNRRLGQRGRQGRWIRQAGRT